MRITDNMRYGQVQRNLASLRSRHATLSNQISTGRQILAPSDDPVAAAKLMRINARAARTRDYRDTIAAARQLCCSADLILVLGSRLALEPCASIVLDPVRTRHVPLVLLGFEETSADAEASLVINEDCQTLLPFATGRAQMVKGDWVKPGATVIDVGITRIDRPDGKQRLIGDVDFAAASAVARAITPVPGGIGPMTIACLLHNTLQAARRAAGLGPAAL